VKPGTRRFSEVPILETERFVVWPSLGGFVEGWVLILPKVHRLSFGTCPPEWLDELDDLVAVVTGRVEDAYGEAAVFEHGPAECATQAGCGIDHAHLHVVPTDVDLLAAGAHAVAAHLVWESVDGFDGLQQTLATRGQSYLYVRQFGVEHVAFAPDLPSQAMRRALAAALERPIFDWKDDLELANARATVGRLA
jgi:ATP adenylyltransferase